MLKKSNVCKIFSLMTVILIMVSMILPMTVFAGVNDLVDLDPTKSNIKTVGFSDTGITGQAIVDEMNGATSTTEYVSGKVFFKAGKLGVETKGKTYTLLQVKEGNKKAVTFSERTDVTFYPMSRIEILNYISTKDPLDKAGSYGIQGPCAIHIKKIKGDYNNVVGLPLSRVYQELKKLLF